MAEQSAVWGIDIGQAGLKAIRLQYAEAAQQVIAVAFDYVPHPKILSQPDAVPDELIAQALQTFLSRNQVRGDRIAISVPGQSALARFIQLPPVETSKIAEIVKYEARQQIPFPLEDVIWDFQTLGSGVEEGGYLLDAEVGLFAMKKDQVAHALKPFTDSKCEIELIQIAPLALYNFLCYDQLGMKTPDAEASGEYYIVLDMGADNTTLLVSNGKKIWIRNVPIGGNHFTRALTKEMKLTFAKAEHLKCNATKSPDPKAVFQALRPVFNDYVAEIQRSIGYFSSVNRDAKIAKIIGVGNGFKLAGLQKFLHQNLQYEVERADSFAGLVGDAVLAAPLFQENALTFAVPYGLAVQALGITRIHTTLLPPEIRTARMIRKKKPWALAAAAVLLAALGTSALGNAVVTSTVSDSRWSDPIKKADDVRSKSSSLKTAYDAEAAKYKKIREEGDFFVTPFDGRVMWAEIYRAINECLPRDVGQQLDEKDLTKRNRINITSITAERYTNLDGWYKGLPESAKDFMSEADKKTGPTGPGYVFTIIGHHFHNEPEKAERQDVLYVVDTFLNDLKKWETQQPGTAQPVPVRKMGITHPAITSSRFDRIQYFPTGRPSNNAGRGGGVGGPMGGLPRPGGGGGAGPPALPGGGGSASKAGEAVRPPANPIAAPGGPGKGAGRPAGPGAPGGAGVGSDESQQSVDVRLTNFTLQFVWQETPPEKRLAQPPAAPAAEGQAAPGGTGAAPGAAPAANAPAAAPGAAPAGAPAAAPPGGAPATAPPPPGGAPATAPPPGGGAAPPPGGPAKAG